MIQLPFFSKINFFLGKVLKDLPVNEGKKPAFDEMRRATTAKLDGLSSPDECTLADLLMEMRSHAHSQKTELRVIKRLLLEALQAHRGDEMDEIGRKFPFSFPLAPTDVANFEAYITEDDKLDEVVSSFIFIIFV